MSYCICHFPNGLEGVRHEILSFWFFSYISLPRSPELPVRADFNQNWENIQM
jgi:hypothetical protein